MGPTESELTIARLLGHEPEARHRCSCGFVPKSPSGVMPTTQFNNHIWTVVMHAKMERAERHGEQYCRYCRGSGESYVYPGHSCAQCGGQGMIATVAREDALMAARARGHEPLPNQFGCICGDEARDWRAHAIQEGEMLLAALARFEEELRD